MDMEHIYDMIVIGGGPGGYTAALYATRAGLDTLVLEKLSAGGQMAQTTQIDNYPGFDEGIDGFALGEKMQAGAERFGAKTELAEVRAVHLTCLLYTSSLRCCISYWDFSISCLRGWVCSAFSSR